MRTHAARPAWGASQHITDRVLRTLEQFLHIEAVSGGALIVAAMIALLWANSPFADAYHALWHTSVTLGIGSVAVTRTLHFLVNEGLMTIFFLVAGLEIRRELHEGALATPKQAALPVIAALGGVTAPALIYLGLNVHEATRHGWAVPIATDIAFAVGVLALLGSAIPRGVRVLLLALAIIDDVLAVLVIVLFYSQELHPEGAYIAACAIALVLLLQHLGIRLAVAYVVPAVLLWFGILRLGVHPALAGVVLGLLTPVVPLTSQYRKALFASRLDQTAGLARAEATQDQEWIDSLKQIQAAQRELIPPAIGVQTALHPWVAYGVMPLFAFANAGVTVTFTDFTAMLSSPVVQGIAFGLLLGKPVGILLASLIAIRLRWCALPADVGWKGLVLIGILAGIGFTMAIFIATLTFGESNTLAAAKLAILLASCLAATTAFGMGKWLLFGGSPPGGLRHAATRRQAC